MYIKYMYILMNVLLKKWSHMIILIVMYTQEIQQTGINEFNHNNERKRKSIILNYKNNGILYFKNHKTNEFFFGVDNKYVIYFF